MHDKSNITLIEGLNRLIELIECMDQFPLWIKTNYPLLHLLNILYLLFNDMICLS